MKQITGSEQGVVKATNEELDLFIKKVCKDKDETLYSLVQALSYKLNEASMISVAEAQIYPQVINRCQHWMSLGNTILE